MEKSGLPLPQGSLPLACRRHQAATLTLTGNWSRGGRAPPPRTRPWHGACAHARLPGASQGRDTCGQQVPAAPPRPPPRARPAPPPRPSALAPPPARDFQASGPEELYSRGGSMGRAIQEPCSEARDPARAGVWSFPSRRERDAGSGGGSKVAAGRAVWCRRRKEGTTPQAEVIVLEVLVTYSIFSKLECGSTEN